MTINNISKILMIGTMVAIAPNLYANSTLNGATSTTTINTTQGTSFEYEIPSHQADLIQGKKDAILGHLYEEAELEALRALLLENAKDSQHKKEQLTEADVDRIIMRRLTEIQKEQALNKPLNNVKFEIRTQRIDVDASEPIELRVVRDYVSSIQFFDETGEPWPIEGEIIGNTHAFQKHTLGQRMNVAAFEVTRSFSESNALVNLQGLDSALVIRLIGSDDVVDSRLSVRIPKSGPNAEIVETLKGRHANASDPQLINTLNGDRLVDSTLYELVGVEGTAMYKDGFLYIRTPEQLFIPPPIEAARTSTGINAYKTLPSEDFLFSVDGVQTEATIRKTHEVPLKHRSSIFN
ncbi:DotH/IcmK family type IV secretion protein [Vibrio breoganii]